MGNVNASKQMKDGGFPRGKNTRNRR